MAHTITQTDLNLLRSRNKDLYIKLELLEENKNGFYVVDEIEGIIISGDYSEDAKSDVRRTLNISMLQIDKSYTVGEYNRIWVDKFIRVYFGQKDTRSRNIYYYKKGIFVFNDAQTVYSASDNSISFSCSDLVSTLDGTHGGEIDAVEVRIPQGSIIREAMIKTIVDLGKIKNYRVDDIGVYTCLKETTEYYLKEREETPDWNLVPYDLEFSTGTTVWEIIVKLRDLYPGFEAFFDEDGTFICQRIPNCDEDNITLTHEIINPLVISENSTIDLSSVRNVTRIYGKAIEVDRYSGDDKCTTSGNVYKVVLDNFVFSTNTIIGVKVDSDSIADMKIQIVDGNGNPYEDVPDPVSIVERKVSTVIKYEDGNIVVDKNPPSDMPIKIEPRVSYEASEAGKYKKKEVYCFKYCSCINTDETEKKMLWVYQGQYQIEALCKNEDEDTAFCVQKIGPRLQVLSGGEFENITTDSLAQENAGYQTWLKSRLNETISLELIDIPFLTVNTKIEYLPLNSSIPERYIVKSIQESFLQGTMTVELMKFYRLYPGTLVLKRYTYYDE